MTSSTSHSRLLHFTTDLAPPENLSLLLPTDGEVACGYFVLRLEMFSSCWTAEKVCFDGFSERELFWGFSAEHDNVGVVRRLWRFGEWRFAVQAAFWEDGLYCADD